MKISPKYSWKKVTLVLLISLLSVSGSMTLGYLFFLNAKLQRISYSEDTLNAIIQTSPQSGAHLFSLETAFLAEALSLSVDSPVKLSQFDLVEAKNRLLQTHVIKDVRLKKMKPDLLFVNYSTRVPFAFLGDYTNTALDEEGILFPYAPFYPPRYLPRIFLGKQHSCNPWGEKMQQEHLVFIKILFTAFGKEKIKSIDLSQVEESSVGRRELIVTLSGGNILRLTPKNYVQQLTNYSILKRTFLKESGSAIIDLRIPEVAYIQKR